MATQKEAELEAQLAMLRRKDQADTDFAIGSASQEIKDGMFRDYEGELDDVDMQIQRANALRDGGSTGGVHAGSAFVASNPWSAVGDIMKQGAGIYHGNKAREERKQIGAERAGTQQGLAEHKYQIAEQAKAQAEQHRLQVQADEQAKMKAQVQQSEALRAQQMQQVQPVQ